MNNPFNKIGINWGAISEKLGGIAKTDLGDILIAVGTGMNALKKIRDQRELEDEDEDEDDDDEDEEEEFEPLKH